MVNSMKVEIMIYAYIAICVSMILYNIVYVFILRHREKALSSNSLKFEKIICDEIEKIKVGEGVSEAHKDFLCKKLDRTAGITAFDKALEKVYENDSESAQKYLYDTFSVFEYLTHRYISKDTLKIAYFPYILHKYNILKGYENEKLTNVLLDLLRSVNVYCRENTLKAIYSINNPQLVISALKIIDKNLTFHHPKLIYDGLLNFKGDKENLKEMLFESFNAYSAGMQLNILNYFRFGNICCDKEMLELLTSEKANNELRFSAIRYFEKFPNDGAGSVIQAIAENMEGRTWEYQAIASSALKSYPGDVTFRILVKNLSSSNWHIRQNSAISLEKLGYTYHDLISVFDGNDRYAREIMRYRLDKRTVESEAMKV